MSPDPNVDICASILAYPLKSCITIALATFQGASYLPAQLQSIASQSYSKWRLLVSDDGSQDNTCDIIKKFALNYPPGKVQLIEGPRQGATANFLNLTEALSPSGWLAYCDQDDVWHADKLQRAASFLENQHKPALYAARTTICDQDLRVLSPAPAFNRPLTFRNALIQACLPGNTIVGNAGALQVLKAALPAAKNAGIISHDWWAYQLMAGTGATLMRDHNEVLYYRQHGQNVMGRNDTARAKIARLSMLWDGTYAEWLRRNLAALRPVEGLLLPENQKILRVFDHALHSMGPVTFAQFLRLGLYRQSRPGTAAIMSAAFAGRLQAPQQDPPHPVRK